MPQCYVVVRKLSMEEISRMSVNPLCIAYKCGWCQERVHYGPKCASCQQYYHYDCAFLQKICCELRLLSREETSKRSWCLKCKESVNFGPQCSICKSKFHSYCISPYEQCCQLNLCERQKALNRCEKCQYIVDFGPKCPLCMAVYHTSCVGEAMECCGVKFTKDDDKIYKCWKCHKRLSLSSPMCVLCGKLVHGYCLRGTSKSCCGKRLALEVYFMPSFKYMISYYTQFDRRRAAMKKLEEMLVTHSYKLRSKKLVQKRVKKKSASSQTTVLDSITIIDVKTELEQKELDIPGSPPPLLEREDAISTPEPQYEPSSSMILETSTESEDTLRNLFDFLYNMVKRFPPALQTQVKIDLFKIVTEAEMKLQCNMHQSL
ncbi:uncharacterized protein BDFB_005840 [Asbolus verrucosus]|uniref:Phorbol-ester/DAG-type domain-containing protein n=1 Tax=Asbolus verrucosus TaxID=1661398 RepID=A0A482V7Q2_ASBVE|nr:uncharacterized protein BDFB_005840 [Asbolus verrucosus]